MFKLHADYEDIDHKVSDLSTLINQVALFFSITMFVSALIIWISFFVMYRTFSSSMNLQGSQYKQNLVVGFFIIGFAYAIRALYSFLYIKYSQFTMQSDNFKSIVIQAIINLCMDLSSILVVLFLNRKTMKLRKFLADKHE